MTTLYAVVAKKDHETIILSVECKLGCKHPMVTDDPAIAHKLTAHLKNQDLEEFRKEGCSFHLVRFESEEIVRDL